MRAILFAATSSLALVSQAALAATAAPHAVDEVVVTAAPYALSLDTVTTSVNVVTRQDLDVATPAGLGDVLNGLPGLRSSFYGPGASRPIIRGLSGPRVIILQNGVGLVDASSLSPDHAVASDPGEASRIEVLRGPSTLAYGGSGIGGVVNVLDERVPSSPAEHGLEGRVSGSYDTVNDGGAISAGLKAGPGPWVVAADIVHRRSQDYGVPSNPVSNRLAARDGLTPAPNRKMQNSEVELDAYGAGLSYVGDQGYLGVSVKRTDTTYGVPFAQILGLVDPDAEGPVEIHLKQTRYDLRGETALDLGPFDKARFSVGYADYQHAEIGVDSHEVGTRFLSNGTEGRLELVQKEVGGRQGAVGIQALERHFEANGDEAFVPSVDVTEYGVFTLQRWDRGTWGIDAGARLDYRKLDADLAMRPASAPAAAAGIDWAAMGQSRAFTNVSASVGVFWKPSDTVFYALTLSHNGRAPTEFELYADGPHGGTSSFELGDPNAKSERVTSLEGTLRYTGDRLRAEGHVYTSRYDGFIDETPSGELEDGLPVYRYAQTDADFHGAEFEGSYAVWRSGERTLAVEAAYDYVRGATDDGPPARIPPYSVTGRLTWASPRLEAKAEVRYVAAQDRVAGFELPTDSYCLVNLSASWKPIADQALKLFIDARNLTNQEAREHASFLKDIAPLPGRSARLGFAYNF